MSFLRYREGERIQEGDYLIAYVNPQNTKCLQVTTGQTLNGRWGSIKASKLLAQKCCFGDKVQTDKGFFFALHPTPALWTNVLPTRTQILFTPDIAMITAELYLRPGSTVIEAGTGSGSFTHALARTVALPPSSARESTRRGKVLTFEFHQQRYETATTEFEEHGISPEVVQTHHRDVCKNGFSDRYKDCVDAVFLDVPEPWLALEHAAKTFRVPLLFFSCLQQSRTHILLKKEGVGRICTFSPCIEQVQRTLAAMREKGYTDLKTVEVLCRSHEVVRKHKELSFETLMHCSTSKPHPVGKRQRRKDQYRLKQKQRRTDASEKKTNDEEMVDEEESEEDDEDIALMVRTEYEMRTHTSYLTFASYLPLDFCF